MEGYLKAAGSLKEAVITTRRPRKFETFCIAAMDYVSWGIGYSGLGSEERENLREVLKMGIAVNNFWDEGWFDKESFGRARRVITGKGLSGDFHTYYGDVIDLERNRPKPEEGFLAVSEYREKVNIVSLGISCAAAGLGKYGELVSEDRLIANESPLWFKDLWNTVMALQVVDDMIGWAGDVQHSRPSFYTALAIGEKMPRNQVVKTLNREWKKYLSSLSESDSFDSSPFVLAVGILGVALPHVYEALRHLPGGKKMMTGREKREG